MVDTASVNNVSVTGRYIKKVSKKTSDWAAIRVVAERPEDLQAVPSTLSADVDGKVYFTVTGVNLPMVEGCFTRFYGKWRSSNGYTSFVCDNAEVLPPETKRGIVAFLSSKQFPGVGKVTAERIAERFGDNTFSVIENTPQELLSVKGITPPKLAAIIRNYASVREYALLSRLLFPYGIGAEKVVRINKRFGEDAIKMIQENPYCLSTVRGITFVDADKVGRGMGRSLSSPQRIEAGLCYVLDKSCTSDTYADLKQLIANSMAVLNNGIEGDPPVTYPAVVDGLKHLASDRKIKVVGNAVFSKAFNDAEYNAAIRLCDLMANKIPAEAETMIRDAVKELMASSSVKYSKKQQDAIAKCVGSRVAVLTGGPGTGKTTVVSGIIKVYTKVFGGDIILMAPTGKAARRMTESTGLPATTIHSRLQLYTTDADVLSDPQPITGSGYVIVDESSMIDAKLMESLMLAIQSTDLHLLFVGDVNQLPSVGAGSVLNEMIRSGVVPVARLTEIFRQKGGGGTIVDNANKVNNGQFDLEYDDTFRIAKVSNEETAVKTIKKLYADEVAEWGIENVALLCPRRKAGKDNRFQCASDALNPVLQELINPAAEGKDFAVIRRQTWRVGDRVMEWKNTPDASNGDVGTILKIEDSNNTITVTVSWENGNTSLLGTDEMESIDLAYALSIHKSQGSEYASVIVPLVADERCSMFQRNLLYTAITRAKKRVILVGDDGSINQCISSVSSNNRKTMFADRLKAHAEN